LNTDDQNYMARLIGRDVAQERALLTLIGTHQRGDLVALTERLRQNNEIGKAQLSTRLQEAKLPADLLRMAEHGFSLTATAIINGVGAHKYQPAPR